MYRVGTQDLTPPMEIKCISQASCLALVWFLSISDVKSCGATLQSWRLKKRENLGKPLPRAANVQVLLRVNCSCRGLAWKGGCCLSPLPQCSNVRWDGRWRAPQQCVESARARARARARGRARSDPFSDDDVPQMSLTRTNDALHKVGTASAGQSAYFCLGLSLRVALFHILWGSDLLKTSISKKIYRIGGRREKCF